MAIVGLRMKVEIGFEETHEVETLCNVEYIEPRDGAGYVEVFIGSHALGREPKALNTLPTYFSYGPTVRT